MLALGCRSHHPSFRRKPEPILIWLFALSIFSDRPQPPIRPTMLALVRRSHHPSFRRKPEPILIWLFALSILSDARSRLATQ